jgi:hypothetical protein
MNHEFYIETTDIEEVMTNYQFPDFSDCESIIGEPEFLINSNEWVEMSDSELDKMTTRLMNICARNVLWTA